MALPALPVLSRKDRRGETGDSNNFVAKADMSIGEQRVLRGKIDERNNFVVKADAMSRDVRNLMGTDYAPLSCNDNIDTMQCVVPFSALVDAAATSEVAIPCGECVFVDYEDGETVSVQGGLHVVGKLHFPPSASVTIETPYVIVQGVLKMEKPEDDNKVKFSLSGTDDVSFFPYDDCCTEVPAPVEHSIAGVSCDGNCAMKQNLGKKPIAVGGGKLEISTIDPTCPSWTTLKDVTKILDPAFCGDGPSGVLAGDGSFEMPHSSSDFFDFPNNSSDFSVLSDSDHPNNMILRQTNRQSYDSGLGIGLNVNCYNLKGVYYNMEFRFKILDPEGAAPNGEFAKVKGKVKWMKDGSEYEWPFLECHAVPNEWKMCTARIFMNLYLPQYVNLQVNFDDSWNTFDVEYDDISFVPEGASAAQVVKGFKVGPDFARCTKPGQEILLTSDTVGDWGNGQHIHTIESVDENEGIIFIVGTSTRSFATEAGPGEPHFAAEVAVLDRDVIFEAKNDDPNENHGGHLIIYHTPQVVQTIQGVKFENFGQAGILGRYPVHFHMSNDCPDSLVSKNVIRNSNQRCIVIHNSNDVIIDDNVAFNTRGHCFATETGSERRNLFRKNLGAKTIELGAINGQSDSTLEVNGPQDNLASTFWIRSTENYWVGNVAAGAQKIGWWFEMLEQSSPQLPGGFVNNSVHSSKEAVIAYPKKGWRPSGGGVIEGFRAYKNSGDGFKFFVSGDITIRNGIIADNGIGVKYFGNQGSGLTLENTQIIGMSQDAQVRFGWTCATTNPGIRYSFNDIHQPNLQNVTFAGFNCGRKTLGPYWESRFGGQPQMGESLSATDVSFRDVDINSMPYFWQEMIGDAWNLFLEDADGSLGPQGKGAGFIIQDNARMKAFLPDDVCEHISGSSSASLFCEGACLRQLNILPSGYSAGTYHTMVLSNQDGTTFEYDTMSWSTKHFNPVLPAGEYVAFFKDIHGNEIFAQSVQVEMGKIPACANYVTENSIMFLTDAPTTVPSAAPSVSIEPSTPPGSLSLFGPDETSGVIDWYGAKTFCESKGMDLATKSEWCSAGGSGTGAIFGGQKPGDQWAAIRDSINGWIQVGEHPVQSIQCKTHYECGWGYPHWGINGAKNAWENNYVLCSSMMSATLFEPIESISDWVGAQQFCTNQEMQLASKAQWLSELSGGQKQGDHWSAIKDTNQWIFVGDTTNPPGLDWEGETFSDLFNGAEPWWGNDGKKWAWENKYILCCNT